MNGSSLDYFLTHCKDLALRRNNSLKYHKVYTLNCVLFASTNNNNKTKHRCLYFHLIRLRTIQNSPHSFRTHTHTPLTQFLTDSNDVQFLVVGGKPEQRTHGERLVVGRSHLDLDATRSTLLLRYDSIRLLCVARVTSPLLLPLALPSSSRLRARRAGRSIDLEDLNGKWKCAHFTWRCRAAGEGRSGGGLPPAGSEINVKPENVRWCERWTLRGRRSEWDDNRTALAGWNEWRIYHREMVWTTMKTRRKAKARQARGELESRRHDDDA